MGWIRIIKVWKGTGETWTNGNAVDARLLGLRISPGDRPAFFALVQLLSPISLLHISIQNIPHSAPTLLRPSWPPLQQPPPPSRQASTTDASVSRRGEKLHVTLPRQRVARAAAALVSSTPPSTSALVSSFAATSLHLSKQQSDIALKSYVANVCFNYFRCFRGQVCCKFISMLQSRSGCYTCCIG
jgi:hypothetical protein